MEVRCFECAALLEARDADAVADTFIVHGREKHTWSYPEQSLRNYARNYAEATERLSKDADKFSRKSQNSPCTLFTEDRIDDWLHFFDRDGFCRQSGLGVVLLPPPARTADRRRAGACVARDRAMMIARLRGGSTFGYLAYVGGRAAGWVRRVRCDPTTGYTATSTLAGPVPRTVIGVSFFVIAPPFRRHGVAAGHCSIT